MIQKVKLLFVGMELGHEYQWIPITCMIVVILSVFLFVKWCFGREKKRLTMYFVRSVIGSVIAMIVIMNLMFKIIQPLFIDEKFQSMLQAQEGFFLGLNLVIIFLVVLFGTFTFSFMALVNRKVRYIQYISEQVKKIELEGFGQTIEVRGNDELTDLSKGINLMSVKLREKIEHEKKIEQTKNELITNVSHDLRTPLTSIMGYVNLLQQNGIEDKDKFEEYISVVDRRLKGLNGMINELFEYTKMTSNEYQLNLSKIDLIVILNHLIQEYEIVLEKTGLIIEKHISLEQAYLMADAQKLIRVIQNLFDNARKYAAKGSKVIIRVYEQEDTFRFEIENQTDRTDLGDVNQIFERFYKGDRSRSEAESSGLGLSIVKRIVELHEGEITVRFKENRICFQLSLPLQNDE